MRRHPVRLDAEPLESRTVPAFGGMLHSLTDATPASGEAFASAVAASGNIALVGFPNATVDGHIGAGVVFVFDLNAGTLLRTIPNPEPAADDHFGSVLAIDGGIAVVGVPFDDAAAGTSSGSVFVFDANTGLPLHRLIDSDPAALDTFGFSVAISGTRIAVGNPSDNLNGFGDVGSVFVFDAISGSKLAMIPNLTNTSTGFGRGVAIDGNVLAVGAPQVDAGGKNNAGAVHLFDATNGQFVRTLNNPTPDTDEFFGEALAFDGGRIVVGVPTDDPGGISNSGSAYLFDAGTGGVVARLVNPDSDTGDAFGSSVAIAGGRVAVGAPGDDPQDVSGAGSAYAFTASDGTFIGAVPKPNPAITDELGRTIAVSGNRLIAGVPRDRVASFTFAGRAYILDLGSAPNVQDDEQVIAEDSGVASIGVLFNDQTTPTPGGNLTVIAVTQPSRGTAAIDGGGTLVTYEPNPNFAGTDTFTYTATDDLGNTGTATVTVIVNPINDRPTISDVTDRSVVVSTAIGPIAVTVGDAETPAANLILSASSSNAALVPPGAFSFGGNGANRTFTILPAGGVTGTATITLEVTDANGLSASDTFVLTVHQFPTLTDLADRRIAPNSTTGPIPFTIGDDFTAPDTLTVRTLSSNTTLVPNANVVLGGSGTSRTVSVTPAAGMMGTATITVSVTDENGATTSDAFELTVGAPGLSRQVVLSGRGGAGALHLPDASGLYPAMPAASFYLSTEFQGAVRSANADVDGDGIDDIIIVSGPGTPLRVGVYSGDASNGYPILVNGFDPFGGDFTGGGFVSAMDLDGDGRAEFAVTPDEGGGPRVSIFSLVGGDAVGVRANFFGIDDEEFRGGARAALGDVNGDGTPDLAVSAGFLGGPRTALFDGTSLFGTPTRLVGDFFAFPGSDATTLRNGVFVAAGDLDGDGRAELMFGGGPGGAPRVFVLSGALLAANDVVGAQANPVANFFVAGNSTDRGGVRLTAKDADGDAKADLVVGSGERSPAKVRIYRGANFTTAAEPGTFQELDLYGGAVLAGGVYVG